MRRRWAPRAHSCCPTAVRESPEKRSTSIAATTSWGSNKFTVYNAQFRVGAAKRARTLSCAPLAVDTHIELKPATAEQEKAGSKNRVFLDQAEVTDLIRTAEVAQASSRLATFAGVRRVLVAEQQRAGAGGGVVMEGRDIGTVVFPSAELKIFLEAAAEMRAERRWKEHQE